MNIQYPIQEYYSLTDLSTIVNLKYRQLQKRIKSVISKHNSDVIYKVSNKWYIHKSIINEFKRIRNLLEYRIYVTIASRYKFDVEYWRVFINLFYKELKRIDNKTRLKYVIESTEREIPHLHFLTTYDNAIDLRKMLKEHHVTTNENGMNKKVKSVWEVKGLHKYFRKQNKPVLLK